MRELFELCAEYKTRLADRAKGWTISYVGLIEGLPGGSSHYGIKPGHLCALASKKSESFHQSIAFCFGIGTPEGEKLDPGTVAEQLDGAMVYAESERKRVRKQLAGQ